VAPVDQQVLYETFRLLYAGDWGVPYLSIDYGDIKEFQEQYWGVQRGTEAYVMDPLELPKLVDYLKSPPLISQESTTGPVIPALARSTANNTDVFARLAPEIIFMIVSEMDIASFNCFRAATPAVARLELVPSWWKARLQRDMPWMYEPFDTTEGDINWSRMYGDIRLRSSDTSSVDIKIHGLVNRRRIWKVCNTIMDAYDGRKSKVDRRANEDLPETLLDAVASSMPLVSSPEGSDISRRRVALLDKFVGLATAEPTITFYWTVKDEIAGLTIHDTSGTQQEILGSRQFIVREDNVPVPVGDWPRGLILVSREGPTPPRDPNKWPVRFRELIGVTILFAKQGSVHLGASEGDKLLLHVSKGHFLVGFSGNWSNTDGRLTRLALLSQPDTVAKTLLSQGTARAGPPLVYGLKDVLHGAIPRFADSPMEETSSSRGLLWRDGIFPRLQLHVSPIATGYWADDWKPDLSPLAVLDLGSLGAISSVAVDVFMRGLEVNYSDGTPARTIGPYHAAMKVLDIDGSGGERIVAALWRVDYIVLGICLVTNRGRCMIVGQISPETRLSSGSSFGAEPGAGSRGELAGMFGYWSRRDPDDGDVRLEAVGVLSDLESDVSYDSPLRPATDSRGLFWEPSPRQRHSSSQDRCMVSETLHKDGMRELSPPSPMMLL
jgi:hypothetical protein